MLDLHREQDYVDVFPPIPVKSASMRGTGQLPKFADDAYRLGGNEEEYDDEDLWLCPTAEVPVTNMYANEILLDDDLPLNTRPTRLTSGARGRRARHRNAGHRPRPPVQQGRTRQLRRTRRRATTALRTSSREAEEVLKQLGLLPHPSSSVPAT